MKGNTSRICCLYCKKRHISGSFSGTTNKVRGVVIIFSGSLGSKYKIYSRFDEIALDIDRLSTGCKTVLNVLYYPNKVFCLKECGNNALEILYHFENGHVFSEYALIPFIMDTVAVQSESGKKIINDYEELREWWDSEK